MLPQKAQAAQNDFLSFCASSSACLWLYCTRFAGSLVYTRANLYRREQLPPPSSQFARVFDVCDEPIRVIENAEITQ